MIAALIAGVPAEEVFSPTFWKWGHLHPQVAALAAGSYSHKQPPEIRGSGYCIDSLEAALWAVTGAVDVRDAVLRAANLGDDADTTAAIAGQLAGARWGYDAIPSTWRTSLVSHDRVVSLADALFDRGSPTPAPSRPWAFDTLQHAWWAIPGMLLAGEYPNRPPASPEHAGPRSANPRNAVGQDDKLEVLLDAGIRTFVDLTSPDDGLTPYDGTLRTLANYRGLDLRHLSFPIPDMGVIELDGYHRIVDAIDVELSCGRPVFVHCWGGVGRTGTVIGCALANRTAGPATAAEVVEHIAALRSGTRKAGRRAPDTDEQIDVVRRWCGA